MRPTLRLALFALLAFGTTPVLAQQAPPRTPAPDARRAEAVRARRTPPTPEQRIARHVARLDQQLTLTDAQEAQLRRIFAEQAARHEGPRAQRREARPQQDRPQQDRPQQARPQQPRTEGARPARPQPTPEQRVQHRATMQAEMEAVQRQILGVLTPAQAEQYRRLQAERRERAEQHRQQRGEPRQQRTPRQGAPRR